MELTEFLLARIAEDEAVARDAAKYVPDGCYIEILLTLTDREAGESHSKRIRPWQPERALAECEAKRQIVDLHSDGSGGGGRRAWCATCSDDEDLVYLPCDTARALSFPYADHPDYREEWKP